MSTEALIKNEMLGWAVRRSLGNLDDAAKYLKIDKNKLEKWEKGEAYPTFNQAQEIARKLRIPFGYLYLSGPPDEDLPLPDLRVKPGTKYNNPSPDFLEILYSAMRKQEWYRDYLVNEDADPIPFVSRYNLSSVVETVADDIRKALDLDEKFRQMTRDKEDYYTKLVERTEASGVLVMRSSIVGNNTRRKLDPNEFQGFAISDSFAPLVFVNQNDYLSAQIFTLMHEIAHIWLGVSGVSIQDYLVVPSVQDEILQNRANEIAAEILVPGDELIFHWKRYQNIDQGLEELRRYYRVSIFVILRRIYTLGLIPYNLYLAKYNDLKKGIYHKKKGGGGGLQPIFSRNSTTITTTLLNAVSEGVVLPSYASKLLSVKPTTLYNMQEFLSGKGTLRA